MRTRIPTGLVAVATMLAACGDGTATAPNAPPIADAGPDQAVNVGETVQLDGSGSSDPDGGSLTYSWVFASRPAGSTAALSSSTSSTPTIIPDVPGQYTVRLTVSDGAASGTDDMVVTANGPPVADAGPDQAVNVGERVELDGSGSSDPEGGSLTYAWSLESRPAGSSAALSNATSSAPTFIPGTRGQYTVQLTVSDGSLSSTDSVVITANGAPTADAGSDQAVSVGETVALDGSGSSDPEGGTLTYLWSFESRPAGSNAILANALSSTPTFVPDVTGEYVVELTVSDGMATSSPDEVTVTATLAQTSLFMTSAGLANQPTTTVSRRRIFSTVGPLMTEWEAILDNRLDGDDYGFDLWLGAGEEAGETGIFVMTLLVERDGAETELATTTFSVPYDSLFKEFTAEVTGLSGGIAGDKIVLRATVTGVTLADFRYGGSLDSHVVVPGVVTVSAVPVPPAMRAGQGVRGTQSVQIELSSNDGTNHIRR